MRLYGSFEISRKDGEAVNRFEEAERDMDAHSNTSAEYLAKHGETILEALTLAQSLKDGEVECVMVPLYQECPGIIGGYRGRLSAVEYQGTTAETMLRTFSCSYPSGMKWPAPHTGGKE